jgi:hypothetical protein
MVNTLHCECRDDGSTPQVTPIIADCRLKISALYFELGVLPFLLMALDHKNQSAIGNWQSPGL